MAADPGDETTEEGNAPENEADETIECVGDVGVLGERKLDEFELSSTVNFRPTPGERCRISGWNVGVDADDEAGVAASDDDVDEEENENTDDGAKDDDEEEDEDEDEVVDGDADKSEGDTKEGVRLAAPGNPPLLMLLNVLLRRKPELEDDEDEDDEEEDEVDMN